MDHTLRGRIFIGGPKLGWKDRFTLQRKGTDREVETLVLLTMIMMVMTIQEIYSYRNNSASFALFGLVSSKIMKFKCNLNGHKMCAPFSLHRLFGSFSAQINS
jgi:hypothetical protein